MRIPLSAVREHQQDNVYKGQKVGWTVLLNLIVMAHQITYIWKIKVYNNNLELSLLITWLYLCFVFICFRGSFHCIHAMLFLQFALLRYGHGYGYTFKLHSSIYIVSWMQSVSICWFVQHSWKTKTWFWNKQLIVSLLVLWYSNNKGFINVRSDYTMTTLWMTGLYVCLKRITLMTFV